MASLLNAALGSDDDDESEDDDYNPMADKTAEREDIHQDAKPTRGGARKRRRGAAVQQAANDGDGGDEGAGGDGDDDDEEDDGEDAVAKAEAAALAEANDPRVAAKRAKVASLWQQINRNAAANGTGSTSRLPSASVNLAALCRSNGAGAKQAKRAAPDEIWMRSLGLLRKPATPADASSPRGQEQQSAGAGAGPSSAGGSAGAAGREGSSQELTSRGGTPGPGQSSEEKWAVAAAALAAARDATAGITRVGKVAVTEVRRFAGKDIQVTLHVDKDSKEAQRAAARAAAPVAPPASKGLDAMLAEIEKKKKVSVLDKTKADWSEFKATNNEVDEELEAYKKSGDQYLDKQNFLKRAELREYEKERDTRLASDVRTRGRL